jgi:hypothetical protein
MIQDVDETLRALVKREALNGSQVEIAFDAPTRDWSARRNAPTINLYLYDIREDMTRRDAAMAPVRSDEGYVSGHSPIPRRFKLSYLLTAWRTSTASSRPASGRSSATTSWRRRTCMAPWPSSRSRPS